MAELTREEWLQDSAEIIVCELLAPLTEIRSDLKIKTSVGFPPNTRTDSKVIGVCLSSKLSEDGYNEIFITPKIADSMLVLETLTHEVIHAVDDNKSGHTGAFKRLARAVGLEGQITATRASSELRERLNEIIDSLGPIPHCKVDIGASKRQTNRNLKVWCGCGFKFNTSRTQIEKVLNLHDEIQCPHCHEAMETNI